MKRKYDKDAELGTTIQELEELGTKEFTRILPDWDTGITVFEWQ